MPKHKDLTIHGNTVGITSESYQGDLNIYIDKGNVKLNKLQGNTIIKLYAGNVYVDAFDTSLKLQSNLGAILVDAENKGKQYNDKSLKNNQFLNISSIKANIIIGTK